MNSYRYSSRLAKKERVRNLRLTVMLSLLTGGILAGLVYFGIPLFVQVAGWWGDVQSTNEPIASDDTLAPPAPQLLLSTAITNQPTLSVRGFSEPGSSVGVYINTQLSKQVVTESNGQFLASDLTLKLGPNEVFAVATDASGNASESSKKEKVIYDNQPPKLTIENPLSGASFQGKDKKMLEIKGYTEEDARVWINDRVVIMGSGGKFLSSMSLNSGEQTFRVKAVDPAGNETLEDIVVTYTP